MSREMHVAAADQLLPITSDQSAAIEELGTHESAAMWDLLHKASALNIALIPSGYAPCRGAGV